EAYVSNANSPLTDIHALESIYLINKNIEKAVMLERDLKSMNKMMLASMYAGIAFSNASLGAVHGMAHSLGGLLDLPHGECNSILLEHIIELNFDAAPEKYVKIADIMGLKPNSPEDGREKLLNRIKELRNNLG